MLRLFFSVLMVLVIVLLSSCSIFSSTRQLNMAPFSENASILFSEAAKISRPFKWKYLKPYINTPEALRLHKRSLPLINALNGIVYYSHQVVAINDSPLKEKDKNRQLARYLSEVLEEAGKEGRLDSLGLSKETLQQALQNIPNAGSYLDAIAEAGPIVNSVVLSLQTRLDGLQEDIAALIVAFDKGVETDFAVSRANFRGLKNLQAQTIGSTRLLYQIQIGESENIDSLLSRDSSLNKFFSSPPAYRSTELEAAEQYLLERLNRIDLVLKQMSDEFYNYHAKQDEIEEWRLNVDEKIRVARNAISIWSQSHRNLGAGIPVPPLVDVSSIATGLVSRATSIFVP